MAEKKIELSIIIVNWNGAEFVGKCLKSVFESKFNKPWEVIVVDNNSSDKSVEIIKQFPQVIAIENKENVGFGAANNQALKQATGKFVFLLNPDTQIFPDSMEKLVEKIEEEEKIAIVAPQLVNENGSLQKEIGTFPGLVDSILVLLKLHRLPFFKDLVYPKVDYSQEQEAEHLMGSALLIRREVLDSVGVFDEHFFLWFEETDLEKRIKEAGWKLIYYPQVRVVHLLSKSIKQVGPLKRQLMWSKSLGIYFRKHKSLIERILLLPFIILGLIIAGSMSLKNIFSK
jgi:GT2 family glycosyltransferase